MPPLAIIHEVSPAFETCELTYLTREPIDRARAAAQHLAYEAALREAGYRVQRSAVNLDCPDSVFVEDTAIILPEVAVLCPMGTASRSAEPQRMRKVLEAHRAVIEFADSAAKLEGGDVLRVGRQLYVGCSTRTNRRGIESLANTVQRFGYAVTAVQVHEALHLKTACCAIDAERVLINRHWLPGPLPSAWKTFDVPESEPWGANFLRLRECLLVPAQHTRTAAILEGLGCRVKRIDISELAKAEAGMTCLSLLVEDEAS